MFNSTDVYAAASAIGQDLQHLLDEHGPDCIEALMLKVIPLLEELEECVGMTEARSVVLNDLQARLASLRTERQQHLHIQQQSALSLERLEQSYYEETQSFLEQIATLEQNNRLLKEKTNNEEGRILQSITSSNSADEESLVSHLLKKSASDQKMHPIDIILPQPDPNSDLSIQEDHLVHVQNVQRLKSTVKEQFMEIRELRKAILHKEAAFDAAEEEVCRLVRQSSGLQSSRATHRRAASRLSAELAEAEARLCACQQTLANSHQPINPLMDASISLDELRNLLFERNELHCRLIELQSELKDLENHKDEEVSSEGPIPKEPLEKYRQSSTRPRLEIKSLFMNLLRKLVFRISVDFSSL